MRAAILNEIGGDLTVREVAATDLVAGEVLVKVHGVGVCHTDLTVIDGALPQHTPIVLGHEGAGVVEAVGPGVTELEVGDHVVCSFTSCGRCRRCSVGSPAYCTRFASLNYAGVRSDGSTTLVDPAGGRVHGNWFGQSTWATHAVASVANAVRVDASLPIELLGPLGCGLLTGAGAVLNVHRPRTGQSYGVWGLGPVGLAAVMAAKSSGCDAIVGVDPNPARRALALDVGATAVYEPADDLAKNLVRETRGGLDFTLEAVGTPAVVHQALMSLASPGSCVTVGFRGPKNPVEVDQGHLLQGRSLRGVIEGDADPHVMIPRLVQMWSDSEFPFDALITTYPFDDIASAVADFRTGVVVKPVLLP
ncbi:NAD(P)-dependent alcohol dehydrogenase [Gordonia sp. HY002]|uniref:NAD(P)-dependent alcohol dehydrogenase n=1 Tax=Gordonia zhenghanii TaxID=2911516 RepID=UPI001EF1144B|nr:NAD(P)-dependent alcohol dehydrogenase [Gordonia zhenghanii]MCF8569811.1 NAD(P)-dependent alcohol dehydrogenase [Gordonia zhenghanii]MCF8606710.1 NAD(P)-dependent alcohol dehydrogenase [Gordonia zhenghanii]